MGQDGQSWVPPTSRAILFNISFIFHLNNLVFGIYATIQSRWTALSGRLLRQFNNYICKGTDGEKQPALLCAIPQIIFFSVSFSARARTAHAFGSHNKTRTNLIGWFVHALFPPLLCHKKEFFLQNVRFKLVFEREYSKWASLGVFIKGGEMRKRNLEGLLLNSSFQYVLSEISIMAVRK